jgi:hypothetical protein
MRDSDPGNGNAEDIHHSGKHSMELNNEGKTCAMSVAARSSRWKVRVSKQSPRVRPGIYSIRIHSALTGFWGDGVVQVDLRDRYFGASFIQKKKDGVGYIGRAAN